MQNSVTIASGLFGTSFFTLTGVHGLHVTLGLIALGALLLLMAMGQNFQPTVNAVSAVSLYWHFVDVVWIFIYSIIYLGMKL